MHERLAAAALTVAALVVPFAPSATAAAGAGAYRSIELKDPVGDVTGPGGAPADDPTLDVYKVIGYRYARNFQITVSFVKLSATAYTHRFVEIVDDGTPGGSVTRSTVVDMYAGADADRPATEVGVYKWDDGEITHYTLPCSGATARPDYRAGRITYTLPVDCLTNTDQSAGDLYAGTGRYRASTWRSRPWESTAAPVHHDDTDEAGWAWDRSVSAG